MQTDMREQIKDYLNRIFAQAPCTQKAIDMKEAILADVLEKYDDMIADGVKPEDAYNRAIGGIGDLNKLITDLRREQPGAVPPPPPTVDRKNVSNRRAVMKSISHAMWMLILVFYFLISFGTGEWHVTWVIFLIGVALDNIVRAIFDLTGGV